MLDLGSSDSGFESQHPDMKKNPDRRAIRRFIQCVRDFYAQNKRILPWRWISDPYKIIVSEVMLQQTQVQRVLIKYDQFLKAFPDFSTLANAKPADVLRVWQGLGYNRRGLNLQRLAQAVVANKGNVPHETELLVKMPGIGKATAASVQAFLWNKPVVFLETNVRTVIIKHFFNDGSGSGKQNHNKKVGEEELFAIAALAMDEDWPHQNAREWYYALMDYGSFLKKSENHSTKAMSYRPQSTFKGSRRQVRGAILRVLTGMTKNDDGGGRKAKNSGENGFISRETLEKAVFSDVGGSFTRNNASKFKAFFEESIEALSKEGLISPSPQNKNKYGIPT